jgi:hypothetical protein
LIRAAYRRQPVRDNECGAPLPQRTQSVLNQSFTFAVETGGGFIKDQQFGIGQNGAGYRNPLALSA